MKDINKKLENIKLEDIEENYGYDIEENNFTIKELNDRIDKVENSKEFRDTMNFLFQQMKEQHPERLRKI